ncbi:unnamed protein product [Musa acuminata subsp. burmannicoides]
MFRMFSLRFLVSVLTSIWNIDRGMLKIVEEEFSRPPMNVVVELLLGLAFCIWAALAAPAKFRSIHPDSEENRYLCICMIYIVFILHLVEAVLNVNCRIVSLPTNLDFMIFNHRGKVFPCNAEYKLKK